MKNLLLFTLFLGLTISSNAQVVRKVLHKYFDEDAGLLILTPSLAHNLSEQSLSSEAGLSAGIQAIENKSNIAIGYTFRRSLADKYQNKNFHSIELSSNLFPFKEVGLGLALQTDYRSGQFLDERISYKSTPVNIDNSGLVPYRDIDDGNYTAFRNTKQRSKIFGSFGVIYRLDDHFRIRTLLTLNDYNPTNWNNPDQRKNPYTNTLKVSMAYNIPILNL